MLTRLRQWWGSRRSTLRDPQAWLKDVLAGDGTHAGIHASEESALKYTAVYACVRVLSESVAGLPLHLYRRDGDARERATDHPLYEVLHLRPNAFQSSFEFRRLLMTWLLTWGNAYCEIVRDDAGQIAELLPLHPSRMRLKAENGRIAYEYLPPQGEKVTLPFERVLHLKGLSTDGWTGLSPIAMARQSIGLSLAAERFGAAYFGAGSRVGGILKFAHATTAKQVAAIREQWEAAFTGVDAFHRVAILDGELDFIPLEISNEDAQFLESRRFGIEDIARIYRVPPHKIADLSRANYSNVDAMERAFVNDSLMPWTINLEQAMTLKLLGPRQRSVYFIEHDLNGLLRGDHESRMRAYQTAIYAGIFSPNDVRRLENLPPRPDGDLYLQPTNLVVSPFFPPQQKQSGAEQ